MSDVLGNSRTYLGQAFGCLKGGSAMQALKAGDETPEADLQQLANLNLKICLPMELSEDVDNALRHINIAAQQAKYLRKQVCPMLTSRQEVVDRSGRVQATKRWAAWRLSKRVWDCPFSRNLLLCCCGFRSEWDEKQV